MGIFPHERSKDWKNLLKEFHNKSDRATAIISAAYLESQLRQLLATFMVEDENYQERLLAPDAPLGTFEARCLACYLLGLISEEEFHDLSLIADIRNAFVNQEENHSFNDPTIYPLCSDFRIPREVLHPNDTPSPRRLFVFTSAVLVRHLMSRIEEAELKRRTSPPPYELYET